MFREYLGMCKGNAENLNVIRCGGMWKHRVSHSDQLHFTDAYRKKSRASTSKILAVTLYSRDGITSLGVKAVQSLREHLSNAKFKLSCKTM